MNASIRPSGGAVTQFPMMPEKITLGADAKFMTYSIISLGDVKIPRGQGIKEISWSGIFPGKARKNYPFVSSWVDPNTLIKRMEQYRDNGTICKLLVTGTCINYSVYISSFKGKYSGGLGDFYYDIKFIIAREIKIYTTKELKIGTSSKTQRPAAVGLAVLSGPITRLIFPGTNGVGGQLLILGGITIILNGNSNITNGVLQGIGKPKLPMIHAAIALVADVIAMALLLVLTNLGVYTIVIAQIVYAVVMCLLNDRSIKKYMGYKNPWRSAYLSPFLASIPMGVVAGVVYYGLYALIHSNVICLGISVILAAVVYFIVYLFVSKPGEEELGMMPGGRYMKKLARMMKII